MVRITKPVDMEVTINKVDISLKHLQTLAVTRDKVMDSNRVAIILVVMVNNKVVVMDSRIKIRIKAVVMVVKVVAVVMVPKVAEVVVATTTKVVVVVDTVANKVVVVVDTAAKEVVAVVGMVKVTMPAAMIDVMTEAAVEAVINQEEVLEVDTTVVVELLARMKLKMV